METTAPDTRLLAFPASTGTRHDAEVRELARQLWGFVHGRNAEAVARALAAIAEKCPEERGPADADWPDGAPVPTARTVRRWAEEEGWAERVERDIVAIAPGIYQSIVVDLIAGAAEGASYLRAAVRGDRPAEPARVNAAHGMLDRAGFKPREAPLPLTDPDAKRAGREQPMSLQERIEWQRKALEEQR